MLLEELPSEIREKIWVDERGCWLWLGDMHAGCPRHRKRSVRSLLSDTFGGNKLHSLCRNPLCVNPRCHVLKGSKEHIQHYIKINSEVDENGCWVWQKSKNKGYGSARIIKGRSVSSHRLSYETFVGNIPKDAPIIHHKCQNKICCNPEHLEATTHLGNMTAPDGVITKSKNKLRQKRYCHKKRTNELRQLQQQYLAKVNQ